MVGARLFGAPMLALLSGRPDLAAKEEAEIIVLTAYLPASASDDEIAAAVAGAVAETGATSAKDMTRVTRLNAEANFGAMLAATRQTGDRVLFDAAVMAVLPSRAAATQVFHSMRISVKRIPRTLTTRNAHG